MSAPRGTVQLFHTCLVNELDPEVGLSVARVLERVGCEVAVPAGQTCCGQPAFNAGFHDEARAAARHTLDVLDATDGPVVVPSGSCADMIVHQYEVLFEDDAEDRARAQRVARRVREFSQFVAAAARDGSPVGGRLAARVTYHPSCHLWRGLGVRAEPPDLLGATEGLEVVPLPEAQECCGFGGLFSVKDPEISGSILARKIAAIRQSGADRVVSCDLGCLLHLAGGLRRAGVPVMAQHLAETLDESLP
ncbi:MAG TPA: (Fe-S)-binding protein [Vicinamibacteria bacterium]|nr:(Fe-S)-binding protein [Vicinamibacteria bacterium]